jgi:hypothetical protein
VRLWASEDGGTQWSEIQAPQIEGQAAMMMVAGCDGDDILAASRHGRPSTQPTRFWRLPARR